MIIVDFNQIMISNIMMQVGTHTNAQIEEGLIRHMVLNTLRSIRTKYKNEYGEMVIACDHRHYWRKEVFPYYKANRKKTRDASDTDWQAIFTCLETIRNELIEYFPYRVLYVARAEADDVIGTLCHKFGVEFGTAEPIIVVSADKDFLQLQKYSNVSQYDPINKKAISTPNPAHYLTEHIIRGDRGDGIPNILSPDDCFVTGERQKKIYDVKVQKWVLQDKTEYCDSQMLERFDRNDRLVNLWNVPQDIQTVMQDLSPAASCDVPVMVSFSRATPFRFSKTPPLGELFVNSDADYLTGNGSDIQVTFSDIGTGSRLGGIAPAMLDVGGFGLDIGGSELAINSPNFDTMIESGFHLTGLYS